MAGQVNAHGPRAPVRHHPEDGVFERGAGVPTARSKETRARRPRNAQNGLTPAPPNCVESDPYAAFAPSDGPVTWDVCVCEYDVPRQTTRLVTHIFSAVAKI